MNRIDKWFDRHDVDNTKRKMKEWETESPSDFFMFVFEDELTFDEVVLLTTYIHLLTSYKIEEHDYIYY